MSQTVSMSFEDLKRSWHERAGIEDLPGHLEAKYGVSVSSVKKLDGGVFRIDCSEGPPWIARVFPAARLAERAAGDAEVLRFLEGQGFPAERVAHAVPVSSLGGQAVLVTEFVKGSQLMGSPEAYRALGDAFGRLHSYPPGTGALARKAGSLHIWAINEGGHERELAAARSWLEEKIRRLSGAKAELGGSLLDAIVSADPCSDLPHALIHPDPALKNVLESKAAGRTFIDWTGAGSGPRITALASLFWHVIQSGGGRVGVTDVMTGYLHHINLEKEEVARLAPAFRIRGLIYAAYIFCNGSTKFPTVEQQIALSEQVADHVRGVLAGRYI